MSFQNLENMSQLAIAQFVYVYDEILKEKSMSHGPATGMELKTLMEEAIYQEKKTEIVEEPVVEVSEVDSEPVVRKGDIAPKDVIKAIKADFHYTQNVEEGEKPRVHRLNLPYLPGSIDYTQGCQAMCLNGGMCSPCMTRLPKDAESIFCKACEKKGGCESDRASFLRASSASKTITFGTYLAKRQVPTEFVKTWVQKHFGEKLIIPEEEWMVDTESVTMARKATASKKSKKTKKTIETSSDEESVGESNAEHVEATNAEPVEATNAEHSANVPEHVEATNAEEGTSDTESTTTNEDVSSDKKKKKSLTKEEKAAKKAEKAAKKAEKEQEKAAKKAEKEAKKAAKEEEKAAKKAEKAAKKAEKTEKKVAKESKKDTHVTAKKGELGYMLPQKEEQEERVELHSEEEEEEEDDYGIKRSFALNGKCYGVDEENTVYEMDGKQPVEMVGTWDTTTSYPIFNDKE
jgi:chemotaxis protein histidine kinase CheA